MSVTINGIRGASAYSGDLSGSFMSPEVVGIKGITISGLPTSDNDTLLFDSASNEFYFSASVGGDGLSTVSTSGNITGSGDVSNPVALKDDISLTSVTASFSGDGSNLTNLPQQDLSSYATTGSNTFSGVQSITSSANALRVLGDATLSTSTLSTYPFYAKNSGSGGVAFGGSGLVTGRIEAMTSTEAFGGVLYLNSQGGGDVFLPNGASQLVLGASTILASTSKILVYASSATNNALDAVTGSIQVRSGSINVTGSINSTGTISGSHTGTANLTSLTASNALISNNLSVAGNLTVNGTMTSVNSTNLEITDKYILIASGAADATALHGAGIQFGSVPSEDARIIYDAVNDEMEIYPAARSAEFRGAFVGDGANITGTPYDIAGEVTGSIVSGSELLNYLSPRAFTMQAFSQYTGSGAASAYVMKNGVSSSFPTAIAANDLITIISTTTGSKAYFTIKGAL